MSVTLILLPLAFAAAAAAGGVGALGAAVTARTGHGTNGADAAPEIRVRTRMKDSTLLADALANLGATAINVARSRVTAEVGGRLLTMTLTEDAVWEAHLEGTGVTVAGATELLQQLDTQYAALVQQAVAAKIRERAGGAGFELVSETRESDNTVTMVLAVRA
ncbi:hypothetical protein D6T64_13790 [Cryobacterium melibiosiphilum]|uniref:DUF1257 domain-containing protein n=1 Tax=Cryobacterium melibiosiphilum TaxID=995039 RepID=A0A3A5MNN5_9MICO|nr:hypothetical protein [Cryobacterium melibiosiphilum]RJT87666.1 hypothetical protein D6T64_13790 [Cryobacterium melibiosiphilum]